MPSVCLSILADPAADVITFREYFEGILTSPWSLPFVDALAIVAAFSAATLALVYFAMRRDVAVPILAVALCGVGIIEMYSTIQPASDTVGKIIKPGDAAKNGATIASVHATTLITLLLCFALARLLLLRASARCRTAPFVGMCVVLVAITLSSVYAFRGDLLPKLMHRAVLPAHWNFISVVASGGLVALLAFRFHSLERSLVSATLLFGLVPYLASQTLSLFPDSELALRTFSIGGVDLEMRRALRFVAYVIPFTGLVIDFLRSYTQHGSRTRVLENVPDGRTMKLRKMNKDLNRQQTELKIAQGMHESANRLLNAQTKELLRARQAADDANAAKSAFLASMSHEIRTPMTAILGVAEQLLDPRLTEKERQQSVGMILHNSRYLLEIVNEILDLSKIEAGELRVDQVRCCPGSIIAEIESLMRPRATEKGLELIVECVGLIPETIETDPVRVRQILINLIGNAIKFTDEGSIRLEYEMVEGDEADGECLEFRVIDTGVGIDEEGLSTIFQPFAQADESSLRKAQGTGLGLTICRELATALGGTVRATSEPGVGSTFYVQIFCGDLHGVRRVERPHAEIVREVNAPEPVEADPAFNCRILLAEDNDTIRLFVRRLLTLSGAEVVEATDGREAVDMSMAALEDGNPFDVVLMDMQMPVLDGYAATRQLRSSDYRGPIVAMTAGAMESDRKRFLEAGCDDFTRKPIDREQLFDTIRRYLG